MRAWGLLLVAALLSAGCALPGGAEEPGAVRQAVDSLTREDPATLPGSIEGVVLTPSLEPIAQARVTLLRENLSVRTDVSGAFQFASLAPGSYLVSAEADGHRARTVSTTTLNGTVTRLNLTLDPAPRPEPHAETRELKGLLSCGLVAATPARETRVDCAPADPNYRDSFEFPLAPGGRSAVIELSWNADEHPGASTLRLVVETLGYGANDLQLGNVTGEGYARVDVPREALDKYYPEGGAMRATVALEPGAAPVGFALQTAFTLYPTVFYVEPGPADFTVLS